MQNLIFNISNLVHTVRWFDLQKRLAEGAPLSLQVNMAIIAIIIVHLLILPFSYTVFCLDTDVHGDKLESWRTGVKIAAFVMY